jgi:hypothetical protein
VSRRSTLGVASRIPGVSAEFLAALDLCLADLDRSVWPDVAWGFSRLNANRYPVEFAFCTAGDEVRVTIEVAGPEMPEPARIDAALSLLGRIGLAGPAPAAVAAWRRLQLGATLRWGCWLSLRQTGRGLSGKLYVEVPREGAVVTVAGDGLSRSADPSAQPTSPFSSASLHMLGYDLRSGATERYFRWPSVSAFECERRLLALGAPCADALMAALEQVIGLPRTSGIAAARLGVSVAGQGRGVAVFVDPESVVGGPAAIHRLMARPGSSYDRLLCGWPASALPEHGILTLVPIADRIGLRVGVAANSLACRPD